jgi:hypothetical protein
MLQSLFSSKLNSCSSNLIFFALGVSATLTATLTITSPASAQSSTIIYQHTSTYDNYHDNYHEPTVIYQQTRSYEKRSLTPRIYRKADTTNTTHFIYGNYITTPVQVNPYTGKVIQDSDNFHHNPYSQQRVIIQPPVRRYNKNATFINPTLVNPNIRNSTIINPRILNPYRHYYGNPVNRNSGTIFIQP